MPIINPIWFYLISLCNELKFFTGAVGITLIFVTAIYPILQYATGDKVNEKLFKRFLIVTCVIVPISILIPNKQTLTNMLVANHITYENLNLGQEAIKETFDYIIEGLKQLQ